jgi:hypothetical protein
MTLLKDLIDIPEHIDKGQFVLRLTEGVTDPKATVAAYVPTPQLVLAFDEALFSGIRVRPRICTGASVAVRATLWRSCT